MYLRMMPLIFFGTFSSMYNYHIGQYGVYRNVDILMKVLTEKQDCQVGRDAVSFLERLD